MLELLPGKSRVMPPQWRGEGQSSIPWPSGHCTQWLKPHRDTRCPGKREMQTRSLPTRRTAAQLPCTALCQSPARPIPLGTDTSTAPLLPGHFIDVHVHVSPQNEHSQGPSLAYPPSCRWTHGGNPWTEAGETLLGQELAEFGVCGAALQPLPPRGVSHGQGKAPRGWSKGPDLARQ